jgi:hypothetical protein
MHLATCFVQRQFGPISSNKTYVYGRALAIKSSARIANCAYPAAIGA